jgi:hypothetical protein
MVARFGVATAVAYVSEIGAAQFLGPGGFLYRELRLWFRLDRHRNASDRDEEGKGSVHQQTRKNGVIKYQVLPSDLSCQQDRHIHCHATDSPQSRRKQS